MPSPTPDSLILMGRIARVHGLRGEVKVWPITDDPQRLMDLERVFVGPEEHEAVPFRVEQARLQPTKRGPLVLLRLGEVTTRAAAEAFDRMLVYAAEADLPLEDDEIFVHDLIGLAVETESGERIGVLREVMALPAHDVLVVERADAPDALVPDVPEFVIEADPAEGRIVIRPIDGLLD